MLFPSEPIALVSRQKLALLRHLGVMLPDGRVAHCTPDRGEHISTIEEFAAGKDVKIERIMGPKQQLPALRRVAAAMAAPAAYNVATNNCESFANRVVRGKAESPQLVGVTILLGLALVAMLAS
jgi:hypothetical protein